MTREDIIRMAREAGWPHAWMDAERLERFAALVAAAAVRETSAEYRMGWNDGQINEREACAKLCEEEGLLWGQRYAAAIRLRSSEH